MTVLRSDYSSEMFLNSFSRLQSFKKTLLAENKCGKILSVENEYLKSLAENKYFSAVGISWAAGVAVARTIPTHCQALVCLFNSCQSNSFWRRSSDPHNSHKA